MHPYDKFKSENPVPERSAFDLTELNRQDILKLDAAAAIEELQAEVKRLEPKRGEYIWIQKENGGQYKGCSICHAPIPTDSMLDYLDDEDCEFCYSCGAKMEVQDATES